MLAPSAFPPAPPRRRLVVAAASIAALCMAVVFLAALEPQASQSSQLSASRFFRSVDPELARLMSPSSATQEAANELRLSSPPPAHSTRSFSFYHRVSSRLAALMRQRQVLAEDASELNDSTLHTGVGASVAPQLPYDEAVELGTPMSLTAFQRADAALGAAHQRAAAALPVCHACVRAAAAAAQARTAASARARAAHAAEERLKAAQRKQRADAAAAAAKIARQRALIAKLQVTALQRCRVAVCIA
jgi:hypothetical protein